MYEVKTGGEGKSSILLEVKVVPPPSFNFNLKHRFGVTWSVEYADGKIESFIAYYMPRKGKFAQKNWKRHVSIEKAHRSALRGIRNSEQNHIWVPSMEPSIENNVLVVRAER